MTELGTLTAISPVKKMTFDFENNNVEVMDLPTLRRTHRENNIYGDPISGLYHFQVIEKIARLCEQHNLDYHIEEIFAAQNKNKTQPGVTLLPKIEQIEGSKAVEAHILRRVYTTIRIDNNQTNELTTTLAIAFHQDGLQVAIGPCVKICHNQCILSAERRIANYGRNKIPTEQIFDTVDQWLSDFDGQMTEDRERIRRLQSTVITEQEIFTYIGILTSMRVAHDSSDKTLSDKVSTYPLNQAQISVFTEEALKKMQTQPTVTAWDLYNIATELYKPGRTDFPAMIPQNGAFADTLFSFCEKKTCSPDKQYKP